MRLLPLALLLSLPLAAQTTNLFVIATPVLHSPYGAGFLLIENMTLMQKYTRVGWPAAMGENGFTLERSQLERAARAATTLLNDSSPIIIQAKALQARVIAVAAPDTGEGDN